MLHRRNVALAVRSPGGPPSRTQERRRRMKQRVELHGLSTCPFAWRTRLAAAEKGMNVEWVPWDAPDAGRRSMAHNPDRHSPVMIHDWLTLTDAVVISLYLDEAF